MKSTTFGQNVLYFNLQRTQLVHYWKVWDLQRWAMCWKAILNVMQLGTIPHKYSLWKTCQPLYGACFPWLSEQRTTLQLGSVCRSHSLQQLLFWHVSGVLPKYIKKRKEEKKLKKRRNPPKTKFAFYLYIWGSYRIQTEAFSLKENAILSASSFINEPNPLFWFIQWLFLAHSSQFLSQGKSFNFLL